MTSKYNLFGAKEPKVFIDSSSFHLEIKALKFGLADETEEIMQGSLVEGELAYFDDCGVDFDLSDVMNRAYKLGDYDLKKDRSLEV
tara:strand:+ start:74 stop:331 length:258 start_codon:yes stop_codon:yes gene_type:complete